MSISISIQQTDSRRYTIIIDNIVVENGRTDDTEHIDSLYQAIANAERRHSRTARMPFQSGAVSIPTYDAQAIAATIAGMQ